MQLPEWLMNMFGRSRHSLETGCDRESRMVEAIQAHQNAAEDVKKQALDSVMHSMRLKYRADTTRLALEELSFRVGQDHER